MWQLEMDCGPSDVSGIASRGLQRFAIDGDLETLRGCRKPVRQTLLVQCVVANWLHVSDRRVSGNLASKVRVDENTHRIQVRLHLLGGHRCLVAIFRFGHAVWASSGVINQPAFAAMVRRTYESKRSSRGEG